MFEATNVQFSLQSGELDVTLQTVVKGIYHIQMWKAGDGHEFNPGILSYIC